LNIALGITATEDKEMYDQYGKQELSYEDWIHRLEKLYLSRGLATKERVYNVLIEYNQISSAKKIRSII